MKLKKRRWIKRILRFFISVILLLIGLVVILWIITPDTGSLKKQNPKTTAMIRYRKSQYFKKTGRTLKIRQNWVPLSRISPGLIHAVLIAEDDNFFQNEGFDMQGMQDAFKKNIKKGHIVSGGSTITQQLAKNLYLNPDRNPIRKIREAVIAYKINRTLKKRRILELYLNVIEWGSGIYGIEAASRYYYQKPASELTAEEATRLASVLPNPVRYHPENDISRRMRQKRRIVAKILVRRKLMTPGEYDALEADLDAAVR